jgi:hypothetical protein
MVIMKESTTVSSCNLDSLGFDCVLLLFRRPCESFEESAFDSMSREFRCCVISDFSRTAYIANGGDVLEGQVAGPSAM